MHSSNVKQNSLPINDTIFFIGSTIFYIFVYFMQGTCADSWVEVSQCSLQKALKLGVVCLIVTLVCISFLNFNKAGKFYPKPKRLLPFAGSVGSDRFPSAWQQFTIPFSSLKDEVFIWLRYFISRL